MIWQFSMLATVDHGRENQALLKPGDSRNTNESDARGIIRAAIYALTTSQASIRRHLPFKHPMVSRKTIWRRLTVADIRIQCPLRHLHFTPHRKQCGLDFCRSRLSWIITKWKRVIFNNESRFSLSAHIRVEVEKLEVRFGICFRVAYSH